MFLVVFWPHFSQEGDEVDGLSLVVLIIVFVPSPITLLFLHSPHNGVEVNVDDEANVVFSLVPVSDVVKLVWKKIQIYLPTNVEIKANCIELKQVITIKPEKRKSNEIIQNRIK